VDRSWERPYGLKFAVGIEDTGALKKEIEQKEDGRYIIFYTFEDEEERG
jgi:hypothetical protein